LGGIGLLEVAQDIIPGRHGKRVDLAIKVAVALIGGVGAMMIERWSQRFRSLMRLENRPPREHL
jgi:VanZ family protein